MWSTSAGAAHRSVGALDADDLVGPTPFSPARSSRCSKPSDEVPIPVAAQLLHGSAITATIAGETRGFPNESCADGQTRAADQAVYEVVSASHEGRISRTSRPIGSRSASPYATQLVASVAAHTLWSVADHVRYERVPFTPTNDSRLSKMAQPGTGQRSFVRAGGVGALAIGDDHRDRPGMGEVRDIGVRDRKSVV